jgi:integrase
MNTKEPHFVPLPEQAAKILSKRKAFSADSPFVFPGKGGNDQHIAKGSLTAALRTLGYSSDEVTVYGFRDMAYAFLSGMGYGTYRIITQLGLKDPNEKSRAYKLSDCLEERREMLQAWADRLDVMKMKQPKEGMP